MWPSWVSEWAWAGWGWAAQALGPSASLWGVNEARTQEEASASFCPPTLISDPSLLPPRTTGDLPSWPDPQSVLQGPWKQGLRWV